MREWILICFLALCAVAYVVLCISGPSGGPGDAEAAYARQSNELTPGYRLSPDGNFGFGYGYESSGFNVIVIE